MPDKVLKIAIQEAIQQFEKKPLATAAIDLLETLGYQSEKRLVLTPNTSEQFREEFDPYKHLNVEKAFLSEWSSVDLLFQITDEEIQGTMAGMGQLFVNQKVDNTIINSYLFFAVGLRDEQYTRTQLAAITREINKLFLMPVMVIFKYGKALTIAIIARRLHKRDPGRDVLEKVTLIKDVAINQPHRAHVEILYDLSVERLAHVHGFNNFVELQHAWEKTLDTSELNKKFFREVANWYFWAVKNVTFPEGAGVEEETRNAISVIRLITRLIFVWFIKEKGLVPEDLFDERRLKELLNFSDPNQSTYYKAILQNLFFATLNTEMGEDRKFRGENEKGRDQHYMVHNVYRYKSYFQDPDSALNVFAGIPFLNGGLFECLDRPDKDDPNKIVRVDGFSKRDDNLLKVPDELFFGDEHEEDLNTIYGTKNKHYKVSGLIHIFNSYKFTIEENTPIEEEIALDPELLGKVFENLLAAYNPETGTTARKQTGSFYTPREIVNYMVDESLIAYLESKLEGPENVQERLRHLLAYNEKHHQFNELEAERLIEAIDTIKVLDPACGSGAFPMGVLHKLVYILTKLDSGNSRWYEIQLQKAIDETEEAYKIGDHEERRIRILDIEEAFDDKASDYGRKLYLIENCIYGVDIQPIAIQISKLRFFISLIVDQKVDRNKKNLDIRPLPNLETKLVAANTLIAIEGTKTGKETKISFGDHLISDKRFELQQIRHKHFRDRTFQSKEKHREQDKQLRAEIAELLKKNGWGSTATAQLAGWDPYDQNTAAEFFDPEWMFGIQEGFDIVVANPPYVDSEIMTANYGELRAKCADMFLSAKGNWDLFVVFIEKGLQLLTNQGLLTYIVPNKLIGVPYADTIRSIMVEYSFIEIRDYSRVDVFKDADVYPITFLLSNKKNKVNVSTVLMKDLNESFFHNQIPPSSFYTYGAWDRWFVPNQVLLIVLKCSKHPSINKFFTVASAATVNDAYEIKKIALELTPKLTSPYKKLVNTGTIDKYSILWSLKPTQYIKDRYLAPVVLDESLKKYSALRYEQSRAEKIIVGGMTKELECAYDNGNVLAGKSTSIILCPGNLHIKYALAILNSRLISFWFKVFYRSLSLAGGYIRISHNDISTIPIPNILSAEQQPIIELVDRILAAKRSEPSADTSALEAEVDRLVYGMYGLTEEEIAIVEGRS